MVFVSGSVLRPDIPRWLQAPRETGGRPWDMVQLRRAALLLSSSAVPPVRAGPEEMRCVGSKRTPEMGRDMLLAASIVKFSGALAPGGNRTVTAIR